MEIILLLNLYKQIFSYKIGSGTNDVELKFPLSYQNINNIGDIGYIILITYYIL